MVVWLKKINFAWFHKNNDFLLTLIFFVEYQDENIENIYFKIWNNN